MVHYKKKLKKKNKNKNLRKTQQKQQLLLLRNIFVVSKTKIGKKIDENGSF
jgi:hypothetical protein